MFFASRSSLFGLVSAIVLGSLGCAAADDSGSETPAPTAIISDRVVVADERAAEAAIVEADRVRIPLELAASYRSMTSGAIFVGARGTVEGGGNPDGFLRRVASVREDGGELVVETAAATLTDVVVRGGLKTSSGARNFDEHESAPRSERAFKGIEIDFANQDLFDNVDEIETPEGTAKFVETIRLEHAILKAKPSVDIDLQIRDGKVSRFSAMVQGNLDTSVRAMTMVSASGDVNETTLAALAAKEHHVRRVIYESKALPLPTVTVGHVPISPSARFTVALVCDLSFGGPLKATAGVEARSFVRMGAVYGDGAWSAPATSEFDIRPVFDVSRGGKANARCAIEAQAELTAFGGGISMGVAPYVDFNVEGEAGSRYRFHANGGALGTIVGSTDVFGLRGEDISRSLAEWKATETVEGSAK